jgi:hypothetical protein
MGANLSFYRNTYSPCLRLSFYKFLKPPQTFESECAVVALSAAFVHHMARLAIQLLENEFELYYAISSERRRETLLGRVWTVTLIMKACGHSTNS